MSVNKQELNNKYTVYIGDLKIEGSAEDIHRLANVYGLAACEYGHQVIEEIHDKHRDNIIFELEKEQKKIEKIEKHLINSIRDSDYYKKFSSEMSAMIDDILEELDQESSPKMIDITVYADTTGLFTEEEIEKENLAYLSFPLEIVQAYASKINPELTFEQWLNDYTADWTEGLYDFAKQQGFKAKRY